jgi:cell wall-associated NlpC family hydrolase
VAVIGRVRRVRGRLPLALLLVLAGALALGPPAGSASAQGLERARARAVAWAVSQEGHHERGTTNCSSRINRWERQMGIDVPPCRPWCGAYVHQAFLRQGIRLSSRLIDPDRSFGDALAGRRGLQRIAIRDVRRGDILFFRIRRGLRASHLAIVRERLSGDRVRTAEGNVSHTVALLTRSLSVPVLAARVTG